MRVGGYSIAERRASKLFTRHRRLIARLLSLALLAAQLGAAAHAYTHLNGRESGSAPGPTQLCGTCALFAPLQAGACGSAQLAPDLAPLAGPELPDFSVPVLYCTPHPAFRSRAPPSLL